MTDSSPELSLDLCRTRQQRVRDRMAEMGVDRAVLVGHSNIQYLTGFRPHRLMQAVVCLEADGDCILSAPNEPPARHAADRVVIFEAQWLCTLRQEQRVAAVESLTGVIGSRLTGRTGIEFSESSPVMPHLVSIGSDRIVDLDPALWKLRRCKDADELAMIRESIACTEAMYERAREIIEPGITELEVFNELHAAAVNVAGEPLTALGNDYQCNSPGGPPRRRAAQAGELFVLDLGPCCRGYYADNCRTIAVTEPTEIQLEAWDRLVKVLAMVEQTVKPGVSASEVYAQAKAMLDEFRPDAFFHHLGHGIGLFPHEAPHLNPQWNDTFAEGDVLTAEPGVYFEPLRAGIRLEQNYLVTPDGVELLTSFPLELSLD